MLQYFSSIVVKMGGFALIVADFMKPIVASCKMWLFNCCKSQNTTKCCKGKGKVKTPIGLYVMVSNQIKLKV